MRQSSLTISTLALNFAKLRGCKPDLRDASVTLDEDPFTITRDGALTILLRFTSRLYQAGTARKRA